MNKDAVSRAHLAGSRLLVLEFVAHRFKAVSNRRGQVVGVVHLYEVRSADGWAPTVQKWCPKEIQTVEAAEKLDGCVLKVGQKIVVQFQYVAADRFDARNGTMIRAESVTPLES